jgi:putative hydrolase of the HAD superfamily
VWTARALDIPLAEAQALRARYFHKYGTTMAGLLRHHPEVDIDDYLEYVHEIRVERYLAPNPALGAMLERLPARKAVFTNAIVSWAERILEHFAIREHFTTIVDVRAVDYLLALLGVPGTACVFLDDQARNLQAGAEFGMRTVLVQAGREPGDGVDFAVDTILDAEPVLQRLLGRASPQE